MSLQNILSQIAKEKRESSNLVSFNKIVVASLGAEVKPFYKKKKDENGQNVKDENGKDVREDEQSGWTYTFNEIGTSKIVKIVFNKNVELPILSIFELTGKGYDIKASSMIFIQEDGLIEELKQ